MTSANLWPAKYGMPSGYIYNLFLNESIIVNLSNIIQQIGVFRSRKGLSNKRKNK